MHVHTLGAYVQDIKFLWSNLWTGGMSTDDNDDDANNDTNDNTRRAIHDCIGSSAVSKWANQLWKHSHTRFQQHVFIQCTCEIKFISSFPQFFNLWFSLSILLFYFLTTFVPKNVHLSSQFFIFTSLKYPARRHTPTPQFKFTYCMTSSSWQACSLRYFLRTNHLQNNSTTQHLQEWRLFVQSQGECIET